MGIEEQLSKKRKETSETRQIEGTLQRVIGRRYDVDWTKLDREEQCEVLRLLTDLERKERQARTDSKLEGIRLGAEQATKLASRR